MEQGAQAPEAIAVVCERGPRRGARRLRDYGQEEGRGQIKWEGSKERAVATFNIGTLSGKVERTMDWIREEDIGWLGLQECHVSGAARKAMSGQIMAQRFTFPYFVCVLG